MSLQGVDFKGKGRKREPRLSAPYVPGKHSSRFWSEAELNVLREHYPSKGILYCLDRLPNRTRTVAYQQAHKLGLKRDGLPAERSSYSQRYPEIDAALREAYPSMAGKGSMNALADKLDVPRWLLSTRARVIGLTTPKIKEPEWSDEETKLLKRVPLHDPDRAHEIFQAHGFNRSGTAIVVRAKRAGLSRRYREKLNSAAVARTLGVDNKTVSTWISKGWLKTERRGTQRSTQQGGDWHLISHADFRQWILDNLDRIDIRKVDKFAFVDILTTGQASAQKAP